jgi:hypothetical protein
VLFTHDYNLPTWKMDTERIMVQSQTWEVVQEPLSWKYPTHFHLLFTFSPFTRPL